MLIRTHILTKRVFELVELCILAWSNLSKFDLGQTGNNCNYIFFGMKVLQFTVLSNEFHQTLNESKSTIKKKERPHPVN